MTTRRLPRCTLFSEADGGWKMGRDGQSMQWEKGMATLTSEPAGVGGVRLRGCDPRDPSEQRLDTVVGMTEYHTEWCSSIRDFFPYGYLAQ